LSDPRQSDRGHAFIEDVAIADVAFQAHGATLGAVFEEAGHAVIETMLDDLGDLRCDERRTVALDEDDLELLLLDFLQELIYLKDAEELLLLPGSVQIEQREGRYHLRASLTGERIDPTRHRLNVDVKAVTLHRFRLQRTENGWQATVVLDV
jgi:SHS2 domain-containing protein